MVIVHIIGNESFQIYSGNITKYLLNCYVLFGNGYIIIMTNLVGVI